MAGGLPGLLVQRLRPSCAFLSFVIYLYWPLPLPFKFHLLSLAHSLYLISLSLCVQISCLPVSPLYEDQHLLSTCRTGACPVVFSQPLRVEQSRTRYGEVQEEDLPIPYLTDDAEELGPCPAGEQHTQRKT